MFGDALRMILLKKKITALELSKKTGISTSAISNILKERRGTKKETFENILEVLDLSESERFDLKKAYYFDVLDKDIFNYFQDLEKENQKLKNLIDAIKFLKK